MPMIQLPSSYQIVINFVVYGTEKYYGTKFYTDAITPSSSACTATTVNNVASPNTVLSTATKSYAVSSWSASTSHFLLFNIPDFDAFTSSTKPTSSELSSSSLIYINNSPCPCIFASPSINSGDTVTLANMAIPDRSGLPTDHLRVFTTGSSASIRNCDYYRAYSQKFDPASLTATITNVRTTPTGYFQNEETQVVIK